MYLRLFCAVRRSVGLFYWMFTVATFASFSCQRPTANQLSLTVKPCSLPYLANASWNLAKPFSNVVDFLT